MSEQSTEVSIQKADVSAFEKKREEMGMSVSEFYAIPRDPASDSKLPIFDEAHVRNAMARFNQVKDVSAEEKRVAYNKIIRAAKKYGIDVEEFKELKPKSLRKSFWKPVLKQFGGKAGTKIVVSDDLPDLEMDIMDKSLLQDWSLAESYPILFDHENKVLSYVGDLTNLEVIHPKIGGVEKSVLVGDPHWLLSNPNAVIAKNMIEEDGAGHMGTSIQAMPPFEYEEEEINGKTFRRYKKAKLLELTLTPMPVNQRGAAMALAKSIKEGFEMSEEEQAPEQEEQEEAQEEQSNEAEDKAEAKIKALENDNELLKKQLNDLSEKVKSIAQKPVETVRNGVNREQAQPADNSAILTKKLSMNEFIGLLNKRGK